jgi:hypothetical protein
MPAIIVFRHGLWGLALLEQLDRLSGRRPQIENDAVLCYRRAMPPGLACRANVIDHRFLAFFDADFFLRIFVPRFFLLAARVLSTRLGWRRPAFFAERLALAFCDRDSFFAFFPAFLRGLGFFQGVLRAIGALSPQS